MFITSFLLRSCELLFRRDHLPQTIGPRDNRPLHAGDPNDPLIMGDRTVIDLTVSFSTLIDIFAGARYPFIHPAGHLIDAP